MCRFNIRQRLAILNLAFDSATLVPRQQLTTTADPHEEAISTVKHILTLAFTKACINYFETNPQTGDPSSTPITSCWSFSDNEPF